MYANDNYPSENVKSRTELWAEPSEGFDEPLLRRDVKSLLSRAKDAADDDFDASPTSGIDSDGSYFLS